MLEGGIDRAGSKARPGEASVSFVTDTDLGKEGADFTGSSNLTRSQFLIWMGQQLHPDDPLYNMVLTFNFGGELDPDHFRQAFQVLLNQSDALRTVIDEVNGVPFQRVLPPYDYTVECFDFSDRTDAEVAIKANIDTRAGRKFDLKTRLFDTALFRLPGDRSVWYLNQHHLITDGWSTALVYRRMADLYEHSLRGSLDEPLDLPQYSAYVTYERTFRHSPLYQIAAAYWAEKTASSTESLRLYGKEAPGRRTRTCRIPFKIDLERSRRLRDLAEREPFRALSTHQSLFNLFATALYAYLHRVSGQSRLVIGTPSHNRPTAAFKETIGVFIEIFPLSVEIDEDETFLSLLSKVRVESNKFLRYALPGASSSGVNRTIQVLLNYIHASFPPFCGLPVVSDWVHAGHGDAHHQLRLQVHDFDETDRFLLHFDFNEDVFDEKAREAAIGHFRRMFDALTEDPSQPIRSVNLLSESERKALLVDFNTPSESYPTASTAVHLFESQVEKTPESIAVTCGEHSLTYRELNERVNRLAHFLKGHGVGPEVMVGLCMRRSIEMVVSILGVLKARGCYVPIDPSFPEDRISLLIEDVKATAVLTQKSLVGRLPVQKTRVVAVDEVFDSNSLPVTNPAVLPLPNDLAYILFTSGSTGRPKGVMIEHCSLANYVSWAKRYYLRGEVLDFPLFTPLSFDLTVTSIFVPLASGGRIVVYEEDEGPFDLTLLRVLEDNQVDVIKLTPSHLALVRDRDFSRSRVKKLILGGEDLKTELARHVTAAFGGRVEIYNEYGPTEATVGCMIHRYGEADDANVSVSIGLPAAGAQIYVLERNGANLIPVPAGVTGEIYIGGPGLARGYYQRPDLTEERFVTNPFREGEQLYRTGDLGRFHPNGTLEYLGRSDFQVKIRGIRIETGEIESVLAKHPDVLSCVVDARQKQRRKEDITYCTRCGLPSNYPEVRFDGEGVCSVCRSYDLYAERASQYFRNLDDLQLIFEQNRREKRSEYDCIMLLSGGKDSTYALCRLVDMGVKVLAYTLDNGYISEEAKANIRRVTETLGVECIFGTTPAMNAIFVDSLKRYSNVCNGCFKTLYTLSLQLAREKGISIIVTGLSRGQFFETRLTEELFWNESVDVARIDRYILEARKAYHRADDAVTRLLNPDSQIDDELLDRVRFIDFYRYCDVGLDEMLTYLNARVPWVRPSDTGRSTNCLINEVGIFVHKKERGYHNYAFPYSWDVRMGHKTREAALQELDDEINLQAVQRILSEIGYDNEIPIDDGSEKRLVAYYTGSRKIPPKEIKDYLSKTLPTYAIPSHFVQLDRLPLSGHGKVDRSQLPEPEGGRAEMETGTVHVAPSGPVEEQIAAIWAEVLRMDRVGANDAFLSLGGNSLLAIQIIARVNQAFGIDLSLQSALEASTVSALARRVEECLLAELDMLSEEEAQRLLDDP